MEEYKIILFISSLFFIIERRPFYNIISFILLIINLSIYIYYTFSYSYLSFLLIIIYSTAIIILFSFILILPQYSNIDNTINKNSKYFIILLSSLFLFLFNFQTSSISSSIGNILPPLIGEYLLSPIGSYYLILILILLFLPIPGIYYLLKL